MSMGQAPKQPSRQLQDRLHKIFEFLASGGGSFLVNKELTTEVPPINTKPLTDEIIRERTGYKVAVVFPDWQTDGAGILSFHDELERLGKDIGWENVIGSVFQDTETGVLKLGVFVK